MRVETRLVGRIMIVEHESEIKMKEVTIEEMLKQE